MSTSAKAKLIITLGAIIAAIIFFDWTTKITNLLGNELFLSIASGVAIFSIGQFIKSLSVKPLNDFRVVVIETNQRLAVHAKELHTGNELYWNEELEEYAVEDRVRRQFNNQAADLESRYLAIPFRPLFILVGLIPTLDDMKAIRIALRQLSERDTSQAVRIQHVEEVKMRLRIDQLD